MNGISPPFSGTIGPFAGNTALGPGLGELASRGWNGHGYAGEDDIKPPDITGGAPAGGFSGGEAGLDAGIENDTLIASFWPCKHAALVPLLNEK